MPSSCLNAWLSIINYRSALIPHMNIIMSHLYHSMIPASTSRPIQYRVYLDPSTNVKGSALNGNSESKQRLTQGVVGEKMYPLA